MRPCSTRRLGALLAMALLLSGCGYRFAARGGALPGGATAVRVPVFQNRTSEQGVEVWFTDAFRAELARRGREAGGAAPVVAEGEVTLVGVAPSIYPAVPRPGEAVTATAVAAYRAQASARVRLLRGVELLGEATVSGTEDYLPGDTPLQSEANRKLALRRLADSLMREAYEKLASGP